MKNSVLFVIWLCLFLHSLSFGEPVGEIQQGYTSLKWVDNENLIFSNWDHWGIYLVNTGDKKFKQIDDDFARGRCINISPGGNLILYKKIFKKENQYKQQAFIYNTENEQSKALLTGGSRIGIPSINRNGIICFSSEESIHLIHENKHLTSININCYCNSTPFSPDGKYILYNDEYDQIHMLEVDSEKTRQITDNECGYSHPQWSADGTKILLQASGEKLYCYDLPSSRLKYIDFGKYPSFIGDQRILYTKIIAEEQIGFKTSLNYYRFDSDKSYIITGLGDLNVRMAIISPNRERIAFTNSRDGSIWLGNLEWVNEIPLVSRYRKLIDAGRIAPVEYYRMTSALHMVMVDAPYISQLYDVPDWFDGGWSCSPSSCLMAVQKYEKLPVHTITCSEPFEHTSDFGWYISNEYSYNGYTYDYLGIAPGDTWVSGAHGYLLREEGAGIWLYIESFLNQHGLTSWQAGTGWSTFCAEIDAGYPMVAATRVYGDTHKILFKGYLSDHTIIANDPYGDANVWPWGDYYNGETVYYDWPGYDNGHLEIVLDQLFGARGEGGGTPGDADTLVDDLSTGFNKGGPPEYWTEYYGGFRTHSWWTYSSDAPDDTNYATWTPVLPSNGIYEVFVFIPDSNSTANASYHVVSLDGDSVVWINQLTYSNEWVSLGEFPFSTSMGSLRLGDATGTPWNPISFDAVKWSYREPLTISSSINTIDKFNISCYPNPFNSAVTIQVAGLVTGNNFTLEISDINGTTVFDNKQDACSYIWKPEPTTPTGLYLIQAHFDNQVLQKKIIYLK